MGVELKTKLEDELMFAAAGPAKQAAAQKTKLEENKKLIGYLQNQNKKLKSANDKAKKEFKKLNNSTDNVSQDIEKMRAANKKLNEDLKARQAIYSAEAQIRVKYQKTLAQILDVLQDNCKNADLVEDVVCVALECESEAKSLLAAAEATVPGL